MKLSILCSALVFCGFVHANDAPEEGGVMRCVDSAAEYHKVNPFLLRAIVNVESRGKKNTVSRNSNNSVDVGAAGINSIHFAELSKFGISPGHLMDECIATYVAAWKVSKHVARFGNTWFGVAAYHSTTPYYNSRYQILLFNDLVAQGVLAGPKMTVPPLRPGVSAQQKKLPDAASAVASSKW